MKAMHHPYLAAALLFSLSAKAAADRLVDPTRPPQAPGPSSSTLPQTLRVEAVLRSADRDLAIVNGKIVRAGDHVNGVQVEAILADGIRYVRDGQVHVARLQPASIPVRR
jgi:MSHA biogenesis protein MshK